MILILDSEKSKTIWREYKDKWLSRVGGGGKRGMSRWSIEDF